MMSSRVSQAKVAIKLKLPGAVTAYRTVRRLAGFGDPYGRRHLNRYIRQETGSTVISGPFAGLRLVEGTSWGDGDVAPKLLGTYEAELHQTLEAWRGRRYDAVVDIGAAEGYYAIGLARMFPGLDVYAFDVDGGALAVGRRLAEANGVGQRVIFGSFCDWTALSRILDRHPRLLILSDCEGYEADLFGVERRPRLDRSDLLIECHETDRPGSTAAMTEALGGTHRVRRIDSFGRNPNQFPFMASLPETDRWRAVCEYRRTASHWLACEAMAPS